jgi:hypothetical protein
MGIGFQFGKMINVLVIDEVVVVEQCELLHATELYT